MTTSRLKTGRPYASARYGTPAASNSSVYVWKLYIPSGASMGLRDSGLVGGVHVRDRLEDRRSSPAQTDVDALSIIWRIYLSPSDVACYQLRHRLFEAHRRLLSWFYAAALLTVESREKWWTRSSIKGDSVTAVTRELSWVPRLRHMQWRDLSLHGDCLRGWYHPACHPVASL